MHPPVQFLTTADNVRIACCTQGEGTPLVFVRGWISHLELLWDDTPFRSYFETIARGHQLVRYDMRGNGLSDRLLAQVTLDDLVLDLEAVMDQLVIERAVLYGATFGGPIAIAYAARHPERVDKLVLDGSYARGSELTTPERQQAILALWRDLPEAAGAVISHWTHPDAQQAPYRQPGKLWEAVTQETAVQLYALGFQIDVEAALPQIQAPTLVLHRRRSFAVPFRLGRALATGIPNARFLALEGRAHNAWEGEAAPALGAVLSFLGGASAVAAQVSAGRTDLLTILFTDMESSTTLTQRLGDLAAQELVHAHNSVVRDALRAYGGSEIKHTGDGIMASFPSASRGIECAIAIQRALAAQDGGGAPLRVRVGLNAGEPVVEDADLFGTAVQLARRVCDAATPGEILASNVVRELAAGKNFSFVDRGETELKGFDTPVRLHEVRW